MTDPNKIPNSVEIIDEHLSDFFDEDDILVLHENESEIVHSDIYIIKPAEDREFNLLVTCGMSSLPMNVPNEFDDLKYAEITMMLPENWKLEFEDFEDENNYWPIRTLIQLSKYPHFNETWFAFGHTIPLDKTQKVNHNFEAIILLKSLRLSDEFTRIETEDDAIVFYSAIPIYKEELDYKLEHGTNKLLDLFEKFDIDEIVDLNRKNVCV